MATLFNNTEITNAFFNGTELDKIYFNGVLVFEKGGKYKRRIMVGDNLKGKILYFDGLTKEEMTNASSIMRAENLSFIIETLPDIGISAIKGDNLPSIGIYPYLKIKSIGPTIYLYDIYNDELETYLSESTIEDDKDYIVTDIDWKYASFAGGDYIDNDGFLYRKFYIEDENIRPLKVGDYVLDNTIFYFTFPDDIYLKEDDLAFREHLIEIEQDPIVDNEGKNWILTLSWEDWNEAKRILYGHGKSGSASYHDNYAIYKYSTKEQELKKNLSKVIAEDMENINGNIHYYCRGKVIKISKSQNFASHILVDTRTLGTSGYKRRIQVGDNLKGKTLYGNFLSNIQDYIYVDPDLPGLTRTIIGFDNNITIIDWSFENQYFIQGSKACFNDETYDIWQNKEGSYLPNTFKEDQDYIVDYVLDNPIYRCLFIEDNKIRPLQVGDKIIKGTKMYFNFPDNIINQLKDLTQDLIIETDNMIGSFASTNIGNGGFWIVAFDAVASALYPYDGNIDGTLTANDSFAILDVNNVFNNTEIETSTVTKIHQNHPAYQYILVDITTLG